MQENWVDEVQDTSLGWGFVIRDDNGKPRLTVGYPSKEDAEAAHAQPWLHSLMQCAFTGGHRCSLNSVMRSGAGPTTSRRIGPWLRTNAATWKTKTSYG